MYTINAYITLTFSLFKSICNLYITLYIIALQFKHKTRNAYIIKHNYLSRKVMIDVNN